MKSTIVFIAAAAMLLDAACNHDRGPVRTTTTGASIVGNDHAADRLSVARCQREQDCNAIGEGKKYADYASCEHQLGRDLQAELRIVVCPSGVLEDKLEECIREIQSRTCDDDADITSQPGTCLTGRMCIE